MRIIWDVNVLFLIIFPLIVLFPIFLIAIGILIDYYDRNRRLKPLKFAVLYSFASFSLAILSFFTGIIYLMFPAIGIIFIVFVVSGIYIRRFYINDKNRRELFQCAKTEDSDEEKNIGITYGKVRR
jgi:uncharacterized membrane protein